MKFIFNYPEVHGLERDLLDSGEITDVAVAVEAAGFDGFALTEHPIPGANWLDHGGHQTLDPFVGLAFAAAVTERIRLLTYLAVAPYRNPFLLAKSAATLDRCSNGRFILGIGTGYHKTEFFALGVDFEERNAALRRGTRRAAEGVVRRALRCRGQALHRPGCDPTSTSDAAPDPDLDRRQLEAHAAARRGAAQGWMPMGIPPEMAKSTRSPHIDGNAALADMISEVQDLAGDRAGEIDFCMSYGGAGIDRPTVDVERHRDGIAELAAIGVNWVSVGPPPGGPSEVLDFARGFGETYCQV